MSKSKSTVDTVTVSLIVTVSRNSNKEEKVIVNRFVDVSLYIYIYSQEVFSSSHTSQSYKFGSQVQYTLNYVHFAAYSNEIVSHKRCLSFPHHKLVLDVCTRTHAHARTFWVYKPNIINARKRHFISSAQGIKIARTKAQNCTRALKSNNIRKTIFMKLLKLTFSHGIINMDNFATKFEMQSVSRI